MNNKLSINDISGLQFGRLTVVNDSGERTNQGKIKWLCICKCGKKAIVSGDNLKNGSTKSCGCLKSEMAKNNIKRLHCVSKDLSNKRFGRLKVIKLINDEGKSSWLCKCDCGKITNATTNRLLSGSTKSCGCLKKDTSRKNAKNMFLRTKNRDLKENTRLPALRSKEFKNNSSGRKGVYWNKRAKKWFASIEFQKKKYHLGYFSHKSDAIRAREEAEKKLFEPMLKKYGESDV